MIKKFEVTFDFTTFALYSQRKIFHFDSQRNVTGRQTKMVITKERYDFKLGHLQK